jgi:hypothetical protein
MYSSCPRNWQVSPAVIASWLPAAVRQFLQGDSMMINVIWRSLTLDFARKPISRLNLIYPYYMNGEMFVEQQKRWLTFPTDILDKLRFIVIDDASPRNPAANFVFDDHGRLNI